MNLNSHTNMKDFFDDIILRAKQDRVIYFNWLAQIREQVMTILEREHPTIKNKSQLAKKLNKEAPEISKILSGRHNLTIETLSKIAAALDKKDLIMTDLRAKELYPTVQQNIIVQFTQPKTSNKDISPGIGIGATPEITEKFLS